MSACHPGRRGAMLREVVLAVVLFVGAASFCMVATRSLFVQLPMWPTRTVVPPSLPSPPAMMTPYLILIRPLMSESLMSSGITGTVSVRASDPLAGNQSTPKASRPAR